MSPRPDVSAQRLPQILDAALQVFARQGIRATTVADIAREAGLSKSLVFMYFGSTDELLLGFAHHYFTPAVGRLEVLSEAGVPLHEALTAWCDEMAAAFEADPGLAAVGHELLVLASHNEPLRTVVATAYRRYHEVLAAMLRRDLGLDEAKAGTLARLLVAEIEGLNLVALVAPRGVSLRQAYREAVAAILPGPPPA